MTRCAVLCAVLFLIACTSPLAPTPVQQQPPAPTQASALRCVAVQSITWADGSASGRTDFVDVRFVIRNTCDGRIRFTGEFVDLVEVKIYDNLSQSGTPIGRSFMDAFDIAPQTETIVEHLVILQRGALADIPGPAAIIMQATVVFV